MALIVKKFGGSSVATPDKMRAIVQRVLKGKKPEDKIVIVVSAMGDTTDDLVALAKQITSKAYGREMDMLLTTGEQVSIALMAMAFQEGRLLYGGSGRHQDQRCFQQGPYSGFEAGPYHEGTGTR